MPRLVYGRKPAEYSNDKSRVICKNVGPREVPECVLREFENVMVSRLGIISTSNNNIIEESVEELIPKKRNTPIKRIGRYRALTSQVYIDIRGKHIQHLEGRYLLLRKSNANNYGHFLTEFLPKVYLLKKAGKLDDCRIMTSRSLSESMRTTTRDAFAALGVAPDTIFEADDDAIYRVKNLLHLSATAKQRPGWTSPIVAECCEFISDTLRKQDAETKSYQRLYISRKPSSGNRRPRNESRLIDFLESYGFKTIYTEEMTFQEEVKTFASAKLIVGIYGAGLANFLFSPRGGSVLCLVPESFPGGEFWDIASIKGHRYYSIFGKMTNPGDNDRHAEFEVDIEEFKQVVEMMMN